MKRRYQVQWAKKAIDNLREIYEYIHNDSPTAAQKLVKEIVRKTEPLAFFPLMFPTEANLAEMNTNYRFLIVKKNYKVIYKVENKSVKIVRIFHAKQNPEKLKNI